MRWSFEEKKLFQEMYEKGLTAAEMLKENRLNRNYHQLMNRIQFLKQKELNHQHTGHQGLWTTEENKIFKEMMEKGLNTTEMVEEKRLNRTYYQIMHHIRYLKKKESNQKKSTTQGFWSAEEKKIFQEMMEKGLNATEMVEEKRLNRTYYQIAGRLQYLKQKNQERLWSTEEKTIFHEMYEKGLTPNEMVMEKRLNRTCTEIANRMKKMEPNPQYYNQGVWTTEENKIIKEMLEKGLNAARMVKEKCLRRTYNQIANRIQSFKKTKQSNMKRGTWSAEENKIFDEMMEKGLTVPEMVKENRLNRNYIQLSNRIQSLKKLEPKQKYTQGFWSAEENKIMQEMMEIGLNATEMVKEKRLNRTYQQISNRIQYLKQTYQDESWSTEEKKIFQEMYEKGLNAAEMVKEKRLNRTYQQIVNRIEKVKKLELNNIGLWSVEENKILEEMMEIGLYVAEMVKENRLNRNYIQLRSRIQYLKQKYQDCWWSTEEREIFQEMYEKGLNAQDMMNEKRLRRTYNQITGRIEYLKQRESDSKNNSQEIEEEKKKSNKKRKYMETIDQVISQMQQGEDTNIRINMEKDFVWVRWGRRIRPKFKRYSLTLL